MLRQLRIRAGLTPMVVITIAKPATTIAIASEDYLRRQPGVHNPSWEAAMPTIPIVLRCVPLGLRLFAAANLAIGPVSTVMAMELPANSPR